MIFVYLVLSPYNGSSNNISLFHVNLLDTNINNNGIT